MTGGTASTIDGLLRTDFPGASPNLFLMNPSGVMFGPDAELDVRGSFHATTADYLKLADGTRFNAVPSAADAVLTTAPPEAFGFLDRTVASIKMDQSRLVGAPDAKLSLVGGDIAIRGGELSTQRGQIDLVSVASKGEVATRGVPETKGFDHLGRIRIGKSRETGERSLVSAEGTKEPGGQGVFIRGGVFELSGGGSRDHFAVLWLEAGGRWGHLGEDAGIDRAFRFGLC